jgi:hypothetical protein
MMKSVSSFWFSRAKNEDSAPDACPGLPHAAGFTLKEISNSMQAGEVANHERFWILLAYA